jgi:hypothetical protein
VVPVVWFVVIIVMQNVVWSRGLTVCPLSWCRSFTVYVGMKVT